MRQSWTNEELTEHWSLLPDERKLLQDKMGKHQLVFAIMLKFFQYMGRFPEGLAELPKIVVNYVAAHLELSTENISDYSLEGRVARDHKLSIRRFLNFRDANNNDSQQIEKWLINDVLLQENSHDIIETKIYDRYRELRIVPPNKSQIEQCIDKATYAFEQSLFSQIAAKLSESTKEVASMIEGVLRHCTDMNIKKNYVDSHGQSEVAFAFSYMLNFQLLPRLKDIGSQKLYRCYDTDIYQNLKEILTSSIKWERIQEQYYQMIKYTVALRLGTADAESILKRFNRHNHIHPTYKALAELGKAIKTIFLCQYLQHEELRQEIHEGLNVIERWNGVNGFIFYGKGGEISINSRDAQELAMLSLHLLQICLVYINTLMIQQILSQKHWKNRLTLEDKRALTPLIHVHINPYGLFLLDMRQRLPLEIRKAA